MHCCVDFQTHPSALSTHSSLHTCVSLNKDSQRKSTAEKEWRGKYWLVSRGLGALKALPKCLQFLELNMSAYFSISKAGHS